MSTQPNYPVVGVSWYECIAFCSWLSQASGENISLPTDQQWQRAAQGDTKWAYPYGSKFDKTRCNFNTEVTTDVTQYMGKDKGDSPFGVVDMSGNVSEWCLTNFQSGDNILDGMDDRIMRGGSWGNNNPDYLRIDRRSHNHPDNSEGFRGFRIIRN